MLQVHSEIGRLREVLVHEPGAEVDLMIPAMMEELLYDDILFGEAARDEHRLFCSILQRLGVRTRAMRPLLAEALATPGSSEWLLSALVDDLHDLVRGQLEAANPDELAGLLIRGIRYSSEIASLKGNDLFELPPLPNFCFQRDPQFVFGDGILFCAMATATRWREALLSRAIFRFHPDFSAIPVVFDPLQPVADRPLNLGMRRPSFEGGDIMALSPELVAMGFSTRSNRAGVQMVARALARREGGPRWLVVVMLPHQRAYMHLDTVFTQIDRDQCLGFPPVLLPNLPESAGVFVYDLHARELAPKSSTALLPTLARHGLSLELVPCGGDDPIQQAREQWTDGANALALAPGVVVLYDRNVGTAEALGRRGYRVVDAVEVQGGDIELDLDRPRRTAILMPSNEISRARGGPHCLTHALRRDAL
jgi:arginine deiminase